MIKLLSSFAVVLLISFKSSETNLLGDSAIRRNRFELIVISAILFLYYIILFLYFYYYLEYIQTFFNLWRPLSKKLFTQ